MPMIRFSPKCHYIHEISAASRIIIRDRLKEVAIRAITTWLQGLGILWGVAVSMVPGEGIGPNVCQFISVGWRRPNGPNTDWTERDMPQYKPARGSESSPENRRITGEANLAHGAAFRWKPGQSGNPGGRPRTAKLSEACRAKLASIVPGDPEGRTVAEAIADDWAQRALKGDIRAAVELADRAEGRPGQNNPGTEEGVKIIVMDIPQPTVTMEDVKPGPLPPSAMKLLGGPSR